MIYAISAIIQTSEIGKYCRPCGGLTPEGIDLGVRGPFCVCYRDACPHEAACTPVIGSVHGDDVCVRKLNSCQTTQINIKGEDYAKRRD